MVRELKYDDDGCRVIHGEMVPSSSSSFRMMGSKERPKYGQNIEAAVDQN